MPENESIAVRLFEKSKIVLEKEIGCGSFGKVYKAHIKEGQLTTAAVKVFKVKEISQREKDTAYEELLKLAVLDHENIVKLQGMVRDANSDLPWLVFEYMKDGNLLEYVIKNDNIKEKSLLRFCKDICCGMAFLHSNNVLHKDLAARNILLSDKTAKIADLGLSSFLTNEEEGTYALNGKLFPYRHAAKECIVEQIYTFESDVWSFGILMHEIFNGGLTPYGRHNKQPEVRRFIVEGITPLNLLEPHCSTKIILIMKSILNPNMKERPTFQQLYKKFQKLLNGTFMDLMSNENAHSSNDTTTDAVSTFHRIKASGLSSSINNLQVSSTSNGSNNHILVSCKKDKDISSTIKVGGYLAVSDNVNLKCSSTPDILGAVEASANSMQLLANNFLSVRSVPGGGRRHSLAKLDNELPLQQRRNSAVVSQNLSSSPNLGNEFLHGEQRQRERANSASRSVNNPLLKGFVQNRFTRKS